MLKVCRNCEHLTFVAWDMDWDEPCSSCGEADWEYEEDED